jgi:hypothetical protein
MEILLSNYCQKSLPIQKKTNQSGKNQTERAVVLFNCILTFAYDLAQDLRNIFEKTTDKIIDLEDWLDGMKSKSIRI